MNKKKATLRYVWEELTRPESSRVNSKKHVSETDRHLARWESFWQNPKRSIVRKVERQHVEEWRRDLLAKGLSVRSANKHVATIRLLLISAEDNGIINRRPKLAMLSEPKTTTKIYLRNEQLDALFSAATELEWPKTNVPASTFWRSGLIMFRTYGFRSQELIAYESSKRPITWENITLDEESPDADSLETSPYGWLQYIPPKTAKKKPNPICIPLTKYARGAINAMRQESIPNTTPIFQNPRNQERFFDTWQRWMKIAGVAPKNESQSFLPKHLRKTCATYMNQFKPGLATAICRWGTASEATVAQDHYISNDLLLREIHNAPMPESFSWALQFLE